MNRMDLRGAIYSKFNSQSEFADALSWSKQKLNYIVNGKREPSVKDVSDMARVLSKPIGEVAQFFLAQ